jgi:pyrimidine-nucleoside phosphorylase
LTIAEIRPHGFDTGAGWAYGAHMLPQWVIERKRDGQALTADEIRGFIDGFTRGDIPDYQMSALAMAVFFRGMTPGETAALTRAMLDSGDRLDTSSIAKPKVDKHSTGGIGDKISLPLAPVAAACGVAVPMISGRGLGITGGTLDKLEAIPGYRTDLSTAEFLDVIHGCGCSIIGQTDRLAPADRKLYALRDVTGTVPSIPLITASILSKKLAEGLDGLVMDVKCGRGAFMRTRAQARALAESLVRTGAALGVRVSGWITAMDEPLGRTAGNALEVVEAIDVLRGRGPADVVELTLALGAEMVRLAGQTTDETEARRRCREALDSGRALAVFRDMVRRQGGDPAVVDDPARLPSCRLRRELRAPAAGVVVDVDAECLGRACLVLGAGRTKTTDTVDPGAGISGLLKRGERVVTGEPLVVLHASDEKRLDEAERLLKDAFGIGPMPDARPLMLERVAG